MSCGTVNAFDCSTPAQIRYTPAPEQSSDKTCSDDVTKLCGEIVDSMKQTLGKMQTLQRKLSNRQSLSSEEFDTIKALLAKLT